MASRAVKAQANGDNFALDTAALILACSTITLLFARHAPQPYMDEPFHVQQTQQYCRGQFREWDPKITTFPGLYILGTAYAWTAGWLLAAVCAVPRQLVCSTVGLRTLNILLIAAFHQICCRLYRRLHPASDLQMASYMALLMTLMPTHFFYVFLFYTDVASATFVLAAYLACLSRRYLFSGALAAAAVLMRQTNAVWACLVLATAGTQLCLPDAERTRRMAAEEQALRLLQSAWRARDELVRRLWVLAAVPAAFAAFVAFNNGIAVGDRANHTPVTHAAQPLYCLLFCLGALAPIELSPQRVKAASVALRRGLRTRLGATLRALGTCGVLMSYVVSEYTLVHPFLLADNRHYTFYLWKDFLGVHPAARMSLVPAYAYAAWALRNSLAAGPQPALWRLLAAACAAAMLVPTWLVEFRYFTIPFTMLALHMRPPPRHAVLATLALYVAVNAATIYVFLFRPFQAADGSVGRFMW